MDIGLHLIFSHILSTSECSRESGYYDLSRTKSFRVEPKNHRIFRASDLTQGELLGKGFFGQVRINCFLVIIYILFFMLERTVELWQHGVPSDTQGYDDCFKNNYQQNKSLLC